MLKPMPSPHGTNHAGLFIRTTILSRDQALAYDSANGIGGGNADKATEMRLAIENLLNELRLDEQQVGRILETLDEFAPLNRLDDDDPNAERARALVAGDDDEDDPLAAVKKLLREKGLSEADIAEALRIAAEGGKATAKDSLPPMGGALAAKRPAMDEAALASREASLDRKFGSARIVRDPNYQAADHALDADCSNAAIDRFAKRFPEGVRIGHA
jgi:hypothetical protein